MFDEDDLVPISALQHLIYCERQLALIHLEQLWQENKFTLEGRLLHEKVDAGKMEHKKNVQLARSLRLRSLKYGITGVADLVEFKKGKDGCQVEAYPVEYKRGKFKKDLSDSVQLCAQGICLEEMLGIKVPKGAFFYGAPRRRFEIEFDESLRNETLKAIQRVHQIFKMRKTPKAIFDEKKCGNCSLIDLCMPTCTNGKTNVSQYLNTLIKEIN